MDTAINAGVDPRATRNFLLGFRQGLASFQERGDEERQIADHCAMGALAVPARLAAAKGRAARFARWFNAPAARKDSQAQQVGRRVEAVA